MTARTRPVRVRNPLAPLTDLSGRRAVVTGGYSGIGLAVTRFLAERGASVVIGVRDPQRGEHVRAELTAATGIPSARIEVQRLDLMDFDSVAEFAEARSAPLDLLILNAGASGGVWRTDRNGIESQFATNHLGHFALTGHLLPALARGNDPRVVTVSSVLYRSASLELDRLTDPRAYSAGRAYNRSKLANAVFAVDLGRRLAGSGSPVRSFAAHPGMARTPMHATYPSPVVRTVTQALATAIGREPEPAAVAVLAAALSPAVTPDRFWGPAGSRTDPDAMGVEFATKATDRASGDQLWAFSSDATGVRYL